MFAFLRSFSFKFFDNKVEYFWTLTNDSYNAFLTSTYLTRKKILSQIYKKVLNNTDSMRTWSFFGPSFYHNARRCVVAVRHDRHSITLLPISMCLSLSYFYLPVRGVQGRWRQDSWTEHPGICPPLWSSNLSRQTRPNYLWGVEKKN